MLKRIQNEMIKAMKEKNVIKKETLRLIISEIKKAQIDERSSKKELKDEDIMKILKRGLKTRHEALKLFEQGNREDLVDKTKKEIAVIEEYLPKQLSPQELEKIVTDTITEIGAATPKDTGKVMQAIMKKYGSQVDGKTTSKIVSQKLT